MTKSLKSFKNLIKFEQNKKYKDNFDVTLQKLDVVKEYSSFDCTIFMYPYGRELNSDSFSISPYQEYVRDVDTGRRSMYRKTENIGDNIFGLVLGFAILAFFWFFNRSEILSIESIVSIFAAYAIGKEFWIDFDNGITNLTQRWKLSWRDNSYYYVKQDFGSIQRFWKLARSNKYNSDTLLAYKLDFMSYSNSKTVELYFRHEDLKGIEDNSVNLVSINFDSDKLQFVQKDNFMFGAKITLSKKVFFGKSNIELFQAVSKGEIGTIDKEEDWVKSSVLVRKTLSLGRLKIYRKSQLESISTIEF